MTAFDWTPAFALGEKILSRPLGDMERQRLRRYAQLLWEWGKVFNLVGDREPEVIIYRHILDSLTMTPLLKKVESLADLGSGAGLPGLVLAVVLPRKCRFTLVEATGKKVEFLRYVIHDLSLGAQVCVLNQRLSPASLPAGNHDAVVTRALGSLDYGASLALQLLSPGGSFWAMKGAKVTDEVERFTHSSYAALFQPAILHPLPGLSEYSSQTAVAVELKLLPPQACST